MPGRPQRRVARATPRRHLNRASSRPPPGQLAAIATLAVGAGSLARKLATARDGVGVLAMRGIEVAASILIVAFGVLLLTGYMANERLFGG